MAKNSGLGAFLVYHGGRRLEKRLDHLGQQKISERVTRNVKTTKPLSARYLDGSEVVMTLTGKHLHGHNNSVFRARTESDIITLMVEMVSIEIMKTDHQPAVLY